MLETSELSRISDNEYFAGSYHKGGDYISNSCMKLYNRGPDILHQTRLGLLEQPKTDAMRLGTISHSIILERRDEYSLIPSEFAISTGLSKKKPAVAWGAQQTLPLITSAELQMLELMAHSVGSHDYVQSIFDGAIFERVGRTRDGVKLQCKMDIVNVGKNILADLKTCQNIDDFEKDIRNRKYAYQLAFYRKVYWKLFGECPDCYLIAVEKQAPYRTAVFHITEQALTAQEYNLNHDLSRIHTDLETGIWRTGYEEPRIYPHEAKEIW